MEGSERISVTNVYLVLMKCLKPLVSTLHALGVNPPPVFWFFSSHIEGSQSIVFE